MPLGFERINERQQRPNTLINFIKPLEGPDKATSLEFLSRIAAQCYPVMKKHYISVMALEEYECNPEFLGRNFNAGEVIQLVLKDKQGRWLSMKFVQMVMMHELAHCKQMNHSRFFWTVRNEYATQMELLWRASYTGEGMWGRGRGLENGVFIRASAPDNTQIPQHLCGGTYRRRGKKRKRGPDWQEQPEKLTYAERQQRRIARKFGKHGDGAELGDDELVRGALETMNGGKRSQGRPRVANSKRGRELRAAAALARFGQAKRATPERTPGLDDDDSGSESESDWEEEAASGSGPGSVVISDRHGRDLVKVCGEGEDDDEGAGKEMDELRMLSAAPVAAEQESHQSQPQPLRGQEGHVDSETESETENVATSTSPMTSSAKRTQSDRRERDKTVPSAAGSQDEAHTAGEGQSQRPGATAAGSHAHDESSAALTEPHRKAPDREQIGRAAVRAKIENSDVRACQMCSYENDGGSATCMVCSNVIRPQLMPNHWRCTGKECRESKYINAGDAGRCGICGGPKPKAPLSAKDMKDTGLSVGVTRPEVLRWD